MRKSLRNLKNPKNPKKSQHPLNSHHLHLRNPNSRKKLRFREVVGEANDRS